MVYVLFVVQTEREAKAINARLPKPGVDKYQAIYCGQLVCGIHHRGKRPNVIVMDYEELTDKHTEWTNVVLRPSANYNAIWITGKYEGKR